MTSDIPPSAVSPVARWLFPLGWILLLAGIGLYFIQFLALKQYVVPWYAPVLGSLGVAAMLVSFIQRRTILRVVGLLLAVLVVAFQWAFLLEFSRLPTYAGPPPGQSIPAFIAIRADGRPFTNADLAGQPTVLLFYRGHW